MRKYIKFILSAIMAIAICQPSMACKKVDELPMDPTIRVGRLKNGLTYYIRHNDTPENLVNFYIAQKVGSIQEEDHHFLAHMCFNGTDHFP